MKLLLIVLFFFQLCYAQEAIVENKTNDNQIPTKEIQNFVNVYHLIKKQYVDNIDSKALINSAIKGMLNELDPHATYIVKENKDDFFKNINGAYQGLGIGISIQNKKVIIISPIKNSPADKSGVLAGDEIIKINDTLTQGLSITEISDLLNTGSEVTLILNRGEIKTITIERGLVELETVNSHLLDEEYGVINIFQFSNNTFEQFRQALDKLNTDNIKGLIIDLRNNPGGLVKSATDIADLFLTKGVIVRSKNNNNGTEKTYLATKEGNTDLPIVILINRNSASASELFAGAMQDYNRALIVGEKSFGKGSVQEIFPLDDGSLAKITIARYYTPKDKLIQAKGITPDILIPNVEVTTKNTKPIYSESSLKDHLEEDKTDLETNQIKSITSDTLIESDFQLYQSVTILKAKNIH